MVAVLAASALGALAVRRRHPASRSVARVLVLPFENHTGDWSLAPIGAIAADWISRGLRDVGVIDVVWLPGQEAMSADSEAAAGTIGARIVALGKRANATEIVVGRLYVMDDSVRMDAKAVDPATNHITESFESIVAPRELPLRALDGLRQGLTSEHAIICARQLSRSTRGFRGTGFAIRSPQTRTHSTSDSSCSRAVVGIATRNTGVSRHHCRPRARGLSTRRNSAELGLTLRWISPKTWCH